ncbi:hypothetical protein DM01DRAFT_1331166 [Hesseltinella vesiculosa]|uniref:Uncharacterized protein n=1 Tax=Hesseltinella vesiculosa TaxID=101127 RepID=A0A1X2GYB6_9FUNG|nr:hypothetical protein DM01DRAFT_1331166 [Hesseltinella vesiculosa]
MTILSSIPFFGSFFSNKSSDGFLKGIQPLSYALKQTRRKPYSRQLKTSAKNNANGSNDAITEYNILLNYPRPNLNPTLQFSLFGLSNSPPDLSNQRQHQNKSVCGNCAGPHSTDFCPC